MEINWTAVATAIAVAAFFRPDVTRLWKKYVKKPKVTIFKTGNLEIGFSGIGATIALRGTLLATNKEVLIPRMLCRVQRLADNETSEMGWVFVREDLISITAQTKTLASGENSQFRLPHAFYAFPETTHPYSVLFSNESTMNEMNRLLEVVREKWSLWSQGILKSYSSHDKGQALGPDEYDLLLVNSFPDFCASPLIANIMEELLKYQFWTAGKYHLEFVVQSASPDDEFKREWYFHITEKDSSLLNKNIMWMLAAICKLPFGQWHYCYPHYEKINMA
jgi:hypothetical protein